MAYINCTIVYNSQIKERQQNGMGLVKAMEEAYGDKHGKTENRGLFNTIDIRGKSDLALELLDDAYKRGVQDELKIMKTIRGTSHMIRIWPR